MLLLLPGSCGCKALCAGSPRPALVASRLIDGGANGAVPIDKLYQAVVMVICAFGASGSVSDSAALLCCRLRYCNMCLRVVDGVHGLRCWLQVTAVTVFR